MYINITCILYSNGRVLSENKRRIELIYSWKGYCPRLVINLHKLDRSARLFETAVFVGDYKHISHFTSSGLWRLFKKWKYLLIENIIYVQVCYCSYDHMQVLRIDKILIFCDIFFKNSHCVTAFTSTRKKQDIAP